MKLDAISSPGLIPSGQKLRNEVIKAVSFVEVQADLIGGEPTQGPVLAAWLEEVLAYMAAKGLYTPAP